jgi:hypothetical protein
MTFGSPVTVYHSTIGEKGTVSLTEKRSVLAKDQRRSLSFGPT